jgi:hypothetical protein
MQWQSGMTHDWRMAAAEIFEGSMRKGQIYVVQYPLLLVPMIAAAAVAATSCSTRRYLQWAAFL